MSARHLTRYARLGALALLAAGGAAVGAQQQQTFTVTALVTANCTISAAGLAFTYDPVVTHATVAATASGSVTIACTKGSAPRIGLNTGSNGASAPAGSTRAMTNGTDFLGYDLFQPTAAPGNGNLWTNIGGANVLNPGAPPSKAARTFTIRGIVPAGQDVSVGNYSDTVTATVDF